MVDCSPCGPSGARPFRRPRLLAAGQTKPPSIRPKPSSTPKRNGGPYVAATAPPMGPYFNGPGDKLPEGLQSLAFLTRTNSAQRDDAGLTQRDDEGLAQRDDAGLTRAMMRV